LRACVAAALPDPAGRFQGSPRARCYIFATSCAGQAMAGITRVWSERRRSRQYQLRSGGAR